MASKIDKKLALIAADFLTLKNQNRSLPRCCCACYFYACASNVYIYATKIELGIPRFCAFTLIFQNNLINQNSTIRNETVTLTNTPHGSLRIIH